VTHSITVPASPAAVFALLTDAQRHPEIDGSGAVRGVVDAPDQLVLGSTFTMQMKAGIPYTTRNTVVEYERDRRIAWRHRARHVWRWELAPVDGGTRVTESWDWSAKRAPGVVRLIGMPKQVDAAIRRSLDNLQLRVPVGA
jgi:uncharacterized protein YndB with AHSA1/START domain